MIYFVDIKGLVGAPSGNFSTSSLVWLFRPVISRSQRRALSKRKSATAFVFAFQRYRLRLPTSRGSARDGQLRAARLGRLASRNLMAESGHSVPSAAGRTEESPHVDERYARDPRTSSAINANRPRVPPVFADRLGVIVN